MKEKYDFNPYGISSTRRLTVPSAERVLYKPQEIPKRGVVRLVDYMGGDDAVLSAATGGVGREALRQKDLSLNEMFDAMYHHGVINPFKFVQMKLHMRMPIESALFWVYVESFKINEMSGRYSILPDEAREVNSSEFLHFVTGRTEKERKEKLEHIVLLFEGLHRQARGGYEVMLSSGFARELARIGLGIGNYTEFYASANLRDLLSAADRARKLSVYNPDLGAFAEVVEHLGSHVAPEATAALIRARDRYETISPLEVDREALETNPAKKPRYGIHKTKRLTVQSAEEMLFVPQEYLARGWFLPVDYMGSDSSIVQSARVSYGAGTTKVQEDHALIRYLRRHRHTTPYEQVSAKAESKTPIFVRPRQAGRHRTWDKEGVLGQWIPLHDHYHVPDEEIKAQSNANRQGRGANLDEKVRQLIRMNLDLTFMNQDWAADELRGLNVPLRLADLRRGVGHMTRGSEQVDLHNLFHYLGLRDDPHAQKEIQLYAQHWDRFAKAIAPVAHSAYIDYQKHALTFTAPELEFVAQMISKGLKDVPYKWFKKKGWVTKAGTHDEALNREAQELQEKLRRLFAENIKV